MINMFSSDPHRVAWEGAVFEQLEQAEGGICRSDAQAMVEAKQSFIDQAYADGATPVQAAVALLEL